ncbi:hypothetical protein DU508_05150 [Pedobacter chinensis]|uniref:Uncharacterized protein n=1 Tax=Pedobacter chinensis TaxID=2282421 RepID=A0A369Q063_9SPHI|nr:hypothetical protein DU508_05150 [Pedobacter chinensis]
MRPLLRRGDEGERFFPTATIIKQSLTTPLPINGSGGLFFFAVPLLQEREIGGNWFEPFLKILLSAPYPLSSRRGDKGEIFFYTKIIKQSLNTPLPIKGSGVCSFCCPSP